MKNTWEKELLDKFGSDIKRDAMCPLEDFIRQLLAQKDKEHIEMTKELVSKKNKDCQRYLETQKNIPMGVSQWKNHGKKWHYWEFWAEQERTQLLEEIEKMETVCLSSGGYETKTNLVPKEIVTEIIKSKQLLDKE